MWRRARREEDEVAEGRRPLRWDLDEAAPANPVILTRAGGHSAVANSVALALAGVDKDTPQPEGGVIEYDEDGELNGVIRERQGIVSRLVPEATPEELHDSHIQTLRRQLELGITSLIQAGETPEGFARWEQIYQDLGEELADILFVLVAMANEQKIDLDAAFERVLDKYEVRDSNRWKRKDAGEE